MSASGGGGPQPPAQARRRRPAAKIAPYAGLLALALLWSACGPGVVETPPPLIRVPQPALRGTLRHPESAARSVTRDIRICAGGDVMLGSNLDTLWARGAASRLGHRVPPFPVPDSLLAPLKPLVADADIVLFNSEGAIGEGSAARKCRPGSTTCYAFRQPVGTAAALARFAYPALMVANVANNHAMDVGLEGFEATIGHLSEAGVFVTGADTLATAVPLPGGDSVGILGFSPFQAGPDPRDLEALRRHIARAAGRYRWVVVSMHTGAEGAGAERTPDESELFLGEDRGNSVAIAHAAVEEGASLVVGHGPHVLRAHEWIGNALVLYSLGNLLTYGPFNLRDPRDRGAIACVTLGTGAGARRAELRSTWQRPPGLAAPDPSGRGAALVDSLSRLDFPNTSGRVTPEGGLIKGSR